MGIKTLPCAHEFCLFGQLTMRYARPEYMTVNAAPLLLIPICLPLLTPAVFSIWSRHATAESREQDQAAHWIKRRRVMRAVTLLAIPVCLAFFFSYCDEKNLGLYFTGWFELLLTFSFANVLGQLLAYSADSRFLGRHWTPINIIRLAIWSTISSSISLFMVAEGMRATLWHLIGGVGLMIFSGFTALIGTARLRSAEGINPRAVKSGELYKRALVLSKRMGVRLREVCVVPFGRGRLTNAYGGWRTIAITDDYGHWLGGPELDFVIGHELAHVKYKHGVKKLLGIPAMFGVAAVLMIFVSRAGGNWTALFYFIVLVIPIAGMYLLSRCFEYVADREAVVLTGDAEAAVRALANLCERTGTPSRCSNFEELFESHPCVSRRIEAIARLGHLPADVVPEIRQGISRRAAGNQDC